MNTARARLLRASPLLSSWPVVRRTSGSSIQSRVNRVRSKCHVDLNFANDNRINRLSKSGVQVGLEAGGGRSKCASAHARPPPDAKPVAHFCDMRSETKLGTIIPRQSHARQ